VDSVDLLTLAPLMELTPGRCEVLVSLIDGPVFMAHPDLASKNIREIPGKGAGVCARAGSAACLHGTFVAGVLFASRSSEAPGICPGCTLLVRPIFGEPGSVRGSMPNAEPEELAAALIQCADAGAHLINLSAAVGEPSSRSQRVLQDALDYAANRGAIVVAAAGNQGSVGSSVITRHRSVIPVVACDSRGRPTVESNLGSSIGRRGLMAPGDDIKSLSSTGGTSRFSGTSAAAPFVTGTLALLWSEFPKAGPAALRSAVSGANESKRSAVVPPLLNACAAHKYLAATYRRG